MRVDVVEVSEVKGKGLVEDGVDVATGLMVVVERSEVPTIVVVA